MDLTTTQNTTLTKEGLKKNVTEKDSKEVLDESPKTGDSFSLALVYRFMIAIAFACIASVVTNVIINKRKELK